MYDLFSNITGGQIVLIWFVGAIIAYLSTAWKEGVEGMAGIGYYMVVSVVIIVSLAGIDLFIFLWRLAA